MKIEKKKMHKSQEDFLSYLRNEFIERSKVNKGYSLRAFARDLKSNHATLSALMSGKRRVTKKSVIKLSAQLKLNDYLISHFVSQVGSSEKPLDNYQVLTIDNFKYISEWYHDAILELTRTVYFKNDVQWISQTLGISITETRSAIDRLKKLELAEEKNGQLIDLSQNNTTNISNDLTSSALREHQEQVLNLSKSALNDLSRSHRDHTSITVAMQEKDLAEVKVKIKKFRHELIKFIQRKGVKPDSVFQFSFSTFPLTINKNTRRSN